MKKTIVIGSVAYDPKVVTIWEGLKAYFQKEGVALDFVLFSNYDAQVEALFARFIDVAWNTNLAFVKTDRRSKGQCQPLAMRDTDLGFTSHVIVKSTSPIAALLDLKNKRVAFGSRDSAQAAVIPEYYLSEANLQADLDYTAVRFNTDMGKHGDTGRSELDVVQSVKSGEVDAGAIGETMWQSLLQSGAAPEFKSIWTSPPYSHCNFTALADLDAAMAQSFVSTLLRMDYGNPEHKLILDMEGLKRWVTGERIGYESVFKAADATGYLQHEKTAAVP
jgi:phosphonate transport system substrate-binding protein